MITLENVLVALEGLENKEAKMVVKYEDGEMYNVVAEFGSYRGNYTAGRIEIDGEETSTVAEILVAGKEFLASGVMEGYKGGEYVVDGEIEMFVDYDGGYAELYVREIVWNEELNAYEFLVGDNILECGCNETEGDYCEKCCPEYY